MTLLMMMMDGSRGEKHINMGDAYMQVYFEGGKVSACIVTCGGLSPGINTVIRELVCGLYHMYGVANVIGIQVNVAPHY